MNDKNRIRDYARIVASRKRRREELLIPNIWEELTRNMESGEIKELRQSLVDDEIIIDAVSRKAPMEIVERYCLVKGYYNCPRCKKKNTYHTGEEPDLYCPRCGQCLEWV